MTKMVEIKHYPNYNENTHEDDYSLINIMVDSIISIDYGKSPSNVLNGIGKVTYFDGLKLCVLRHALVKDVIFKINYKG